MAFLPMIINGGGGSGSGANGIINTFMGYYSTDRVIGWYVDDDGVFTGNIRLASWSTSNPDFAPFITKAVISGSTQKYTLEAGDYLYSREQNGSFNVKNQPITSDGTTVLESSGTHNMLLITKL